MKRSALAGLLICATLTTSHAFASNEGDLCERNLQTLTSELSNATKLDAATQSDATSKLQQAKSAYAAKNDRECVSLTQQALQSVQSHKNSQ